MGVHVMIVEDEDSLSVMLRYNFENKGFEVTTVARGDEVELAIKEQRPDVMVLDWMLPGVSGLEICRRLRRQSDTQSLPVIMLTARSQEENRIRGLEVGADDYLTKPFAVAELIARTRALLRRSCPERMNTVLEAAGIRLNRETHKVERNNRPVHLSPTEFRLLEHFLQSTGRVFTREQLLDVVWGHGVYVSERTVDVHIGRLRKALNIGKAKNCIRTVRGAGYALDA